MAEIDIGDDLTVCPVCFEVYEVSGDFIPRLLPCSHTLCEKCLEQLLTNGKLDCPECRTKHEAVSGTKSFPQNKYIIAHIIKTESGNDCRNSSDKFGPLPETSLPLLGNIKSLKNTLRSNKEKLLASRKKIEENNASCIAEIQNKKEEHLKVMAAKYDMLLLKANQCKKTTNTSVDENVAVIDEQIALLETIENKAKKVSTTDDDIAIDTQTVNGMRKQVERNLAKAKNPKYLRYNKSTQAVETLCGHLESIGLYEQGKRIPTALP